MQTKRGDARCEMPWNSRQASHKGYPEAALPNDLADARVRCVILLPALAACRAAPLEDDEVAPLAEHGPNGHNGEPDPQTVDEAAEQADDLVSSERREREDEERADEDGPAAGEVANLFCYRLEPGDDAAVSCVSLSAGVLCRVWLWAGLMGNTHSSWKMTASATTTLSTMSMA